MTKARYVFFLVLYFAAISLAAQEDLGPDGMADREEMEFALIMAADQGDTLKLSRLISLEVDVNAATTEGVTALMYAVQNADLASTRLLLDAGAKPDVRPDNGYTALITAIRAIDFDMAELLIRRGARLDQADNWGYTPLMHAIVVDSFYMADFLLYYGASAEAKSSDGISPLMLASWMGKAALVNLLLEYGAQTDATDKKGRTALYYGAASGNSIVVEALINYGAKPDMPAENLATPLIVAITQNDFESSRLLISAGAQVNHQAGCSLSPLSAARQNRNDLIVQMLRNNGAEERFRPCFDKYVLHLNYIFHAEDRFTGLSWGIYDKRHSIQAVLSYALRPGTLQVLHRQDKNSAFQYFETRHLVGVSASKGLIRPIGKSSIRAGGYAGLGGVMSFGGYRGTKDAPPMKYALVPHFGFSIEHGNTAVNLQYDFMNLGLEDYDNRWFHFSLAFAISRKRTGSVVPKWKGL